MQDFTLAKQPLYQLSLIQVPSLKPVSVRDPVSCLEAPRDLSLGLLPQRMRKETNHLLWVGYIGKLLQGVKTLASPKALEQAAILALACCLPLPS